jgi:hypothetical protein
MNTKDPIIRERVAPIPIDFPTKQYETREREGVRGDDHDGPLGVKCNSFWI